MFGKKIQIASDLHLEFPENRDFLEKNPIIPKAKILLLAGDIVSDNKRDKAEFFFKKWQNDFKLIVEVPGNHEYYYHIYHHNKLSFSSTKFFRNKSVILLDHYRFFYRFRQALHTELLRRKSSKVAEPHPPQTSCRDAKC